MTQVTVKTTSPHTASLELLAVLLPKGEAPDPKLDAEGAAARAIALGDFKGKPKQSLLLYPGGGVKAKRTLLVGLGPKKKLDREGIRRAVGAVIRRARKLEVASVGIAFGSLPRKLTEAQILALAGEAAVMAGYHYDHKSAKSKRPTLKVSLFGETAHPDATEAAKVAEAVNLARDLANAPGNVGTPTHLAAVARKAGRAAGFKVKVIEPAEMKKLGMGGLLGVAKGSAEPARFIVMDYNPKTKTKGVGPICLVGKGLTFDAGGISLKPADKMWDMKFDKCGGCAVIGAMQAIAATRLPVRVIGLVPSTENMPGGAANKPGDVLTALNGKTIEVLNTDAEGRLILADALAYSARFNPSVILDFATLTGACAVALGDIRGAVMSPDAKLAQEVQAAGEVAGDLVWPLPMDDAYGDQVKGDVGDVKNLGKGRLAGSIAGGWFLRNFVPDDTPWAHLDIAGVAWNTADPGKGYVGKGASGFGVRLAWEFVKARCAK